MTVSLLKSFLRSSVKGLSCLLSCNRIETRKANFHATRRNLHAKCTDGPAYTTRLALPPDYDNVLDFMYDAFYRQEPAVVNMGICDNGDVPQCWQNMLYDQLKEGMSIIAVDRDHCVIGAALNSVSLPSDSRRLYEFAKCCEQPKLRRVIEFYAYVSEKSNLWERYCVSRVFQQSSLAVSSDYQCMGIARRLVEESWLLARDCGFRLFSIECNSIYCSKISEGFGWRAVWSIPFNQYVRNGELVFKHIQEPHTTCQVFVDELKNYKTYHLPYKKTKSVESLPPK